MRGRGREGEGERAGRENGGGGNEGRKGGQGRREGKQVERAGGRERSGGRGRKIKGSPIVQVMVLHFLWWIATQYILQLFVPQAQMIQFC